jgi:DnaJ domain
MFFAEFVKAVVFLFIGCLFTRSLDGGCAPCSSSPAKLCFTDRAASLNTLGLQGNATLKDVQRAYTALALQYHPDKAGEAEVEVNYNCAYVKAAD